MRSKNTRHTRDDGLVVFLDGDEVLDKIRKQGTKREVIMAVAMRRAQQIAQNYAREYCPELESVFKGDCLLPKTITSDY